MLVPSLLRSRFSASGIATLCEVLKVNEKGGTPEAFRLATYGYDEIGRLVSIARGNGADTTYDYDPISRLDALTQDLAGAGDDLALTFGYNPASQIATSTRSNESYSFDDHVADTIPSVANGLNQLTQVGGQTLGYDQRGNLVSDPTGPGAAKAYTYSSENLLTGVDQGATALAGLRYDPLLRLNRVTGSGMTRWFGWDGADLIAEYNYGGTLVRRYVHGPGMDNPLVWYEGTGTADRRWLHADERGSAIAVTDGTGAAIVKNTYDEYGIPGAANDGRFQYTGQLWIEEAGLYYYKARFYDPRLGRFMQTDPIGYAGGMNLYAYVGGDPINRIDPTGLWWASRIERKHKDGVTSWGFSSGGSSRGGALDSGGAVRLDSPIVQSLMVTTDYWVDVEVATGRVDDTGIYGVSFSGFSGYVQMASNGGIGHNQPPEGFWSRFRKGLGMIGAILSLKGDTCDTCISTTIGPHIINSLEQRGWTDKLIRDAIDNPTRTVSWSDTRHLPGGGQLNDPATAYYSQHGGYVVRNDRTGDVVQISDRFNPNWKAPWGG